MENAQENPTIGAFAKAGSPVNVDDPLLSAWAGLLLPAERPTVAGIRRYGQADGRG